MFLSDPILSAEPFWTRTRVVSLLLAIWYIMIAAAHYPRAVVFDVAVTTIVLIVILWLPEEFHRYYMWGSRHAVNRHEASALEKMARLFLWCLFLARIPWFIATWSVASWPKSWLPQEPTPPLHFFSP